MEGIAANASESRPRWWRAVAVDVGPKLFVTAVAAGISALLIPWITGNWQDHKQQLELRTTLAGEMSRAYTSVIVSGRFVAGGLVYSGSRDKVVNRAATQQAWTRALHEWLVESGTIGAQLTGRYGPSGIARDWREFSAPVTVYMRLGSQVRRAEREDLVRREKAYVNDPAVGWRALEETRQGFKKDPAFRTAYARLGAALIGRGDALIEEELQLRPRV